MKWFNLKSISTRLLLLISMIPILMTVLIIFTFFSMKDLQRVSLTNIERALIEAHQVKVKALATSMAAALGETLKDIKGQKEREAHVRRIINPIRFFPNNTGYYFAYRMDGTRIALPTAPHLVGRNSFNETSPAPAQMRDFIAKAQEGGGFSQWSWGKPGKKGLFLKQGYVAPIAGTDLLLLTAVYIDDIETEKIAVGTMFDQVLKDTVKWSIVAGVLILFGVLPMLLFFVKRGILQPIRKVTVVAKAIANGDFSVEFPHSAPNETGEMVEAFKQMVHQRQEAEENAVNRQNFLSSILSHVPDAIIILDAQHRVLDWNPGAEKLFGYNCEETIGIDLDNLVAIGDVYDEATGYTRNILAGEKMPPVDTVRSCKDGSLVNVIASGTPIYSDGKFKNVVAVYTDITEHKQVLQELMNSEEKFSKTFNFSPNAITISLLQTGELIDVNQGFLDMFGYTRGESIGTTTVELGLHADPSDRQKMVEILKETGKIRSFEVLGTTKSGSNLMTEISCEIIEIHGEQCLTSIVRDITDRKKAEVELRHIRNYLSNIIDSMPSMLIGVNTDGIITEWNREARKITDIAAEEAIGQPLVKIIPYLSSQGERIQEAVKTRQNQTELKKARHENGIIIYEDIIIYPLVANGVDGVVIRIDDVTDKVRMEEMMIQSEKMLSVGGLAAGMAHEINNPLAGVMQTASVLSNRLTNIEMPANVRVAEEIGIDLSDINTFMEKRGILRMITAINESGRRMAVIVANMLGFARQSDAQMSFHALSELFDKTLDLAVTDFDLKKHYDFKTIQIKKKYDDNVPPVPCESTKIQQVLLNILRNGAQAMQEAGIEKPVFSVRVRFEENQKMVCVEIKDNGPGMDENILKRVFEPFYTTKPVGVGTGLGLSVSYFIISENHGGEMSVESTLGSGAKFIIRLPVGGKISDSN